MNHALSSILPIPQVHPTPTIGSCRIPAAGLPRPKKRGQRPRHTNIAATARPSIPHVVGGVPPKCCPVDRSIFLDFSSTSQKNSSISIVYLQYYLTSILFCEQFASSFLHFLFTLWGVFCFLTWLWRFVAVSSLFFSDFRSCIPLFPLFCCCHFCNFWNCFFSSRTSLSSSGRFSCSS